MVALPLGDVFENNLKNVLGSEAGCNIIVIIRWTRSAQTASHVDLLVSLRDTRIEEDSDNSTYSKDLFVRNVFEIYSQRHEARSAVTALPLGLSKNVFEIYSQRHVALWGGSVSEANKAKYGEPWREWNDWKGKGWRAIPRFLWRGFPLGIN